MARASHNAAVARVVERETAVGYVIGIPDPAEAKKLSMRLMGFHLLMMVLFLTVLLTIPAFIAAGANLLLSPKLALRRLELDGRGIELSRVYARTSSGPSLLLEGGGSGSFLFGLRIGGSEPLRIDYPAIQQLTLNGQRLTIAHEGGTEVVDVSALRITERSALLKRLSQARERAITGLLRSAVEDESDFEALQALTRSRETEGA
ncbi:MAG: hypothetical protein KC912_23095 [Proteobacteria bacterium]|nr:hypothetical protein [Pseudomonadota bacterium]